MPNPTRLNRRQLLASTGLAATALAASAACAQTAGTAATSSSLSGKSILITGASSGFGRLGAEHYARLGAKVFASMRNMPRPEAEALRALADDEDLDITVIEIDVTSDEQVATGVAAVLAETGGTLDVLINNAGISYAGSVEMQDMRATEHMFQTNVFGPHRMARAVLPAMRKAGAGQIFNISSQLGRLVVPAYGQYSPTKFALEAMSEQLAYEVAAQGIEVTIIQPGGYPTKIWENSEANTDQLLERTPEALQATYGSMIEGVLTAGAAPRNTDPMDIPREIAAIIAMPTGDRPLRKAVHPRFRPQEPINDASAQVQLAMLGESSFGPAVKAVLE